MRQLGAKAAGGDCRLHLRRPLGRQEQVGSRPLPQGRAPGKEILATSDAEWQRLAPRIGVRDAAALAIYRQRYAEGIFRRPIAEEEADARALYRVLAEVGGSRARRPGARARPRHVLPTGGVNVALRLLSLALMIAAWYAGAQLAGPRMLPDPQAVALMIVAKRAQARLHSISAPRSRAWPRPSPSRW